MLEKTTFYREVSQRIGVPLKPDQIEAVERIHDFLFFGDPRSVFILKGYAGTGKTTLMGGLIRWFHSVNRKTVLLAPTGRSAKVLSAHSGFPASTIHRRIYTVKQSETGRLVMELVDNKAKRTIFIVDEASMIGDRDTEGGPGMRSLLEDLVEYVYSGERCRLILIGDDAQLPPVGMDQSPGLDKKKIASLARGAVFDATLTQVARQERTSLILKNATVLRKQIGAGDFGSLRLEAHAGEEVCEVDPYELGEKLEAAFSGDRSNDSVIICRSNKDANRFNQQIRSRILWREGEVEAGDRMMIVKNNYFWEIPGQRQNFLANGDMITVERVHRIATFGPFRFAECQVRFSDDDARGFDLILLLNSIDTEGPSIPARELFQLREQLIESGEVDAAEPEERFFQNPYFNAVQVKYAYAVTCHKSQGGQWGEVFIYQGYFTPDMLGLSYFRWLYTALTRATSQVYLVNFHKEFISGPEG